MSVREAARNRRRLCCGIGCAIGSLVLISFGVRCAPAAPPTALPSSRPAVSAIPSTPTASAQSAAAILSAPQRPACAPLVLQSPDIPQEHLDTPVPLIVDSTGQAMQRFYERLAQVLRGTAKDHVRLGFYGDSNMTMDLISGAMRRMIQRKFGDAGHGFVAIGRPWRHYRHMDVVHDLDQTAWEEYAISTRKVHDGIYGFSGIASQSSQRGAKAWVRTAGEASPIGRTASRLEVHYLRKPGNGVFSILLDGSKLAEVSTDAAELSAAVQRIDVAEGPHSVELIAKGRHPVRLFGVALERSAPGVVIDALGIGGVSAHSLTTGHRQIVSQSLANRRYDLIVFMLGTNTVLPSTQPEAMRQVISMHREGIPDLSILVMSPPDHARNFRDRSDPATVRVASQMREIAEQNRCAFWDFWQAMGGQGSMLEFHKKKWNQWDLYHLNEKGASYMASRIVAALWRDFGEWLRTHPEAGCIPQ